MLSTYEIRKNSVKLYNKQEQLRKLQNKSYSRNARKIGWQNLSSYNALLAEGEGVKTSGFQGASYSLWNICVKILACLKRGPSGNIRNIFLRPDLNSFLKFLIVFWFTISVTLKMTIQIYFFVKKVCKKKSPIKFVGNFLSRKEHIRAHPNEYEIYVEKYFLVWKKTRAATANNRNNVF